MAVVLETQHVAVHALREQGTIGIVVIGLLHASALGNYHSIISHIVLIVVMPAIDCTIGILQLRQAMTRRTGFVDAFYYVV